jgi:arginine N-succinyltransferase
MAENRKFFEDQVIAELRGMVNDSGHSPFWDAVGKNFFKIDFPTADYLYVKNKRFIEELMPKHPIITNLLPEEAQFVVGKVHPNTEPAKRILEQEGFRLSGLVGIFEPGPVLIAEVDNIRAIKESTIGAIAEVSDKNFKSEIFIISRTTGNFRSALGGVVKLKDGGYKVSGVTAAALKLRLGDKIRFVSFKPKAAPIKKKVTTKKKTTKSS